MVVIARAANRGEWLLVRVDHDCFLLEIIAVTVCFFTFLFIRCDLQLPGRFYAVSSTDDAVTVLLFLLNFQYLFVASDCHI